MSQIPKKLTFQEIEGFDEEEKDNLSHTLTGQKDLPAVEMKYPKSPSPFPGCHLLESLRGLWSQSSDPLNPSILEALIELSKLEGDERLEYVQRYKRLVALSGSDMTEFIDILIPATFDGNLALKWALKMVVSAYSAASERNAVSAINDI